LKKRELEAEKRLKELHRIGCLPNISVLPFIIQFCILAQLVNIFLPLACLIDSDLYRFFVFAARRKNVNPMFTAWPGVAAARCRKYHWLKLHNNDRNII